MNKKLSILSLLFGLFLCVTVFSACGGDDESSSGDNGGSGSIPQTSKHVAKIITEQPYRIFEETYTYDSQGRVTKVIETETGTYQDIRTEITYQYGETVIIRKEVEEGISNGQSYSSSGSCAYTVENGRIVKYKQGSTTTTYSYDANNYLSSIRTEYSDTESETSTITWSNGNIIKAGDMTYSYSNYSWVKGIPFKLVGDSYLFSMGYYGNTPRNLPSKKSNRSALTEEWINEYEYALYEWSYEYTLQDNYVTKMIAKPTRENNKYHINTSTIIWE
jgi:YD repeat-containing protein